MYRTIRGFFIFHFILGTIQLFEQQEISESYITQANYIIDRCRMEGVSKAMVRISELNGAVPVMHNCYQDIIVFSSLNSPDSSLQVVYVTDSMATALQQLKENEVLLDQNKSPISFSGLNPDYYRLKEEPYTLVSLIDSTRYN
jgi:hypothetical protein